jgi:hypothetical protein
MYVRPVVSIPTDYGLDGPEFVVRFREGAGNFAFFFLSVQTGTTAHLASYTLGKGGGALRR